MRIGITGVGNSHAHHYIRMLNAENMYPGTQVVAFVAGSESRNRELAELGNIDLHVESAEDLIGHIDALIVTDQDGAVHMRNAEPLLRAGIPTFVDKPLATSIADAATIIEAAASGEAGLSSFSALRFAPAMAELKTRASNVGQVRAIRVTGPASPASEFSGLFYYGIHAVEIAFQLAEDLGADLSVREVGVTAETGRVIASARLDDLDLIVELVDPDVHARVPFRAVITGSAGEIASDVVGGPNYLVPVMDRIIPAFARNVSVARHDTLMPPVEFLESITALLHEPDPRRSQA